MKEKVLFLLNAILSWVWKNPNKCNSNAIRDILIIKWDEIGDMVATLHVFNMLQQKFPKAKITVVCKPFVSSLLTNNPNIYQIITDLNKIPTRNVDLWIELRGTFKTFFKSILSFPKYRVDRGSIRFKQRGNQPHEVETNYNIIKPLVNPIINFHGEIYLTTEDNRRVEELVRNFGVEKFVVCHPGGRSLLRRWRTLNFAEVVDYIWDKYRLKTVLLGTSDESEILHEINNLTKDKSIIWETKESLKVLYGVLKKSNLFLGNESGPLQFADLAKIPTLGLFGPGVERVFYPRNSQSSVIHHILPCNPCDQVNCKQPHDWCMDRIKISEVQKNIEFLLRDYSIVK